jgi:hypothetical protein
MGGVNLLDALGRRVCLQYFVRESDRIRLILERRRRWEDNIKMEMKGVVCEGMD